MSKMTPMKIVSVAVLAVAFLSSIAATAVACSPGDEQRAIQIAIQEVGADRETHIFVPVASSGDCDDWVVYKRTPGTRGVTAAIVTIENWEVIDVTLCPIGC